MTSKIHAGVSAGGIKLAPPLWLNSEQPAVAQGPADKGEYRTELSLKTSAATVDQTREEERERDGTASVIPRIAPRMELALSFNEGTFS